MNQQFEIVNGVKVNHKIEWTDYTWNVLVGCLHNCEWIVNGKKAKCYAKSIVEGRWMQNTYPDGFEHSYFHPKRLVEPTKLKEPSKIFPDSLSDLFGYWVHETHLFAVMDVMEATPQHIYQCLTKNANGYNRYQVELPNNMWPGVSSPPDHMFNTDLDDNQRERYLHKALGILSDLRCDRNKTTWMSFEPLSQDWASIVYQYPKALKWAVIGAASNGRNYYPPEEKHVRNLIDVLDDQGVKVFFKGNLKSLPWAAANWRSEFPHV